MQYSEIKNFASSHYSPFIETSFIDFDNGSPSEGAMYLRFINHRVVAKPHEYEFAKEIGSITLNGSSTINLATYYPDLLTVYQVFGVSEQRQENFLPNDVANVAQIDGYSIRGKILYFSGNIPSSGILYFQYKSQYMVKDANGNRKLDFTDDDDYSVLDEAHTSVLLYGLGEFVNWKTDEFSAERRKFTRESFIEILGDIMSTNSNTNQIGNLL